MNFNDTKERMPLGRVLFRMEEWHRRRLRKDLLSLGLSQGQWKGLLTYADAHKLPPFIRDTIVKELPETAELFTHPDFKTE